MKFDDLIAGIVKRAGAGEMPVPAEDGSVRLRFAETEMRLTPVYSSYALLIETEVCPLPSHGAAAFMLKLLQDNHRERLLAGGAFAVDDARNVLHRHIFVLDCVDDEMICDALPDYLKRIREWRELSVKCEAGRQANNQASSELAEPYQSFMFLRV